MEHHYFVRYSIAGLSPYNSFVCAIEIIPGNSANQTTYIILESIVREHYLSNKVKLNNEDIVINVLTRIN